MVPGVANYKDFVRGDTINARQFTLTKDSNPIDLTNCIIKCDFVLNKSIQSKTIGNGITLINAALGQFQIDSFVLDKVGEWHYDIEITFTSGEIKTYIKGVINIESDVTK